MYVFVISCCYIDLPLCFSFFQFIKPCQQSPKPMKVWKLSFYQLTRAPQQGKNLTFTTPGRRTMIRCGNYIDKKKPHQGTFWCLSWKRNEISYIFCRALLGCGPPGLPCTSTGSKQYFIPLPWQSAGSGGVGRCLWNRNSVQGGTLTTVIPQFLRTRTTHNTTFLSLAFQYKNICLANSQPRICLWIRWMYMDSNILWVWMEVRACWRPPGAAACTKN